MIPYLSGKPGLMTYSRGFHDSLSSFYLESYQPDLASTPWFPDLLRMLNIRYVVAQKAHVTKEFIDRCDLRVLLKLTNDSYVLVRSSERDYGYFEFVRVPGFIRGDLKGIRPAALASTGLYTTGKLLAINPETVPNDDEVSRIIVKPVMNISFTPQWNLLGRLLGLVTPVERYDATWRLPRRGSVAESRWLEEMGDSEDADIKSVVLKETVTPNEYSAVVEIPVATDEKGFYHREHLLLKVTFHPYWTCRYTEPAIITNLRNNAQEHTNDEYDSWTEVPVHHVTPNFMSLLLPPGKHHVVCSYHNPLYQKLGFVLFVATAFVIGLKETAEFGKVHRWLAWQRTETPKK